MQNMYPGKVNSPQTELAQAIDDEQTTIPLLDASVLPDPPNLATIGTGENAETVLYEGIDGNDLIDVTRGFQGAAKAWSAGAKVARLFTAYDHDAFIENINSHASRHATGGADPLTPEMIGALSKSGAQIMAPNSTITLPSPGNSVGASELIIGAPLAYPGFTFREPNGHRRDIRAEGNGLFLGASADSSAPLSGLSITPSEMRFSGNIVYHAGNLPVESGTWTPRLVIGGVVPGSVTYSVQVGRYTRIGNRVIADFELQLSSKGTATGNVRIGYLPFVTASVPRSHALLTFHNVTLSSNMTSISISTFGAGETEATLYQIGSDQSFTQLSTSNLKDNSGLYGQIIYTIGG